MQWGVMVLLKKLLMVLFIIKNQTIIISTLVIGIVASFKFVVYYLLLKFRVVFGGNYRKTIIIGSGLQAENLQEYFNTKKEAGFKIKQF